jgi:excisionase family DNA binding protein
MQAARYKSMTRDDYEWVTLKQYARELGVSDKTVRRWIRHGKVVAVQHERRGHWRIRIQKEAKAS